MLYKPRSLSNPGDILSYWLNMRNPDDHDSLPGGYSTLKAAREDAYDFVEPGHPIIIEETGDVIYAVNHKGRRAVLICVVRGGQYRLYHLHKDGTLSKDYLPAKESWHGPLERSARRDDLHQYPFEYAPPPHQGAVAYGQRPYLGRIVPGQYGGGDQHRTLHVRDVRYAVDHGDVRAVLGREPGHARQCQWRPAGLFADVRDPPAVDDAGGGVGEPRHAVMPPPYFPMGQMGEDGRIVQMVLPPQDEETHPVPDHVFIERERGRRGGW